MCEGGTFALMKLQTRYGTNMIRQSSDKPNVLDKKLTERLSSAAVFPLVPKADDVNLFPVLNSSLGHFHVKYQTFLYDCEEAGLAPLPPPRRTPYKHSTILFELCSPTHYSSFEE